MNLKPINTPLNIVHHAAIKEAFHVVLQQQGANVLQMAHEVFSALDAAAIAAGVQPANTAPAAAANAEPAPAVPLPPPTPSPRRPSR